MGYHHYMRGMSNGGSIFSRGEPLTNAELHARVPSIFATEAHESRSARFAPVPTITVLDGLRAEGFEPFFAQQARTRTEGKAEFTKHMLRLRHRGIVNEAGEAFEIVLVNANDGTSAYQMIPGFFRFVCANGLMAGETFEEVKVRHSGNAIGEVIEGAYRVLENAPRVADQVQRFKSIRLQDREREILAEAAHSLRFPATVEGKAAPIDPPALLRPRRSEDRATDLWTAFNVVQENTLRGGMRGRIQTGSGFIRRQTVREVTGIDQSRALNRALWMLTERMAELKSAA
ncbi:DUF945 domain-containing protein (plasmid) [Cereibacter azotoformans]|uniref:DUF932 domain-containing protein n=1 Tax=Cereibacter azotoformans TaxID=43057 RepID=UPI000E35C9BC|nr:DUF932 domain-containing protein [Cereibacter azotoformans]AXQ96327.1 DUF945 domain-containing protein [Cereibacter sphaeroides]UIJ33246.1 DUF945 domain-containing protein [Cereibacter azotoformans]